MEKLKNLVNPGSKKDDEVMYGSGRSDDPVHSGNIHTGSTNPSSGEGSHFGSNRATGHDSLSTSSNPTGLSQYERDTSTGTSQYDSAAARGASHGLKEPYASRMPGGFDNDDAASTASVSSGIPGQSQSRAAKSGAHDPTFIEKPLPHEPASGAGFGHGQSSLTGNSYPDRSVEESARHGDPSSSSHLSRDASLGAGVATTSAHHYGHSERDNHTPETGRSFPLGGSSTSDGYGATTAGSHSSNLANKADPRVDSDSSRITDNTGYGSNSQDDRSHTTGAKLDSGNQGSLGHARGVGGGTVGSERTGATGYGPESWQHEHQRHGHQYEGDPCETGAVDAQGGPHFFSGPHLTDTANRLDPHVGSGSASAGATGHSSRHHHHSDHVHRGEDAALAGGAGGAGLGALETDHHRKGATGNFTSSKPDPSDTDRRGVSDTEGGAYNNNSGTTTSALSAGKTGGPHRSNMLNKLDPRVDSDSSKLQGSHGNDHHYGRDAALTGAGGAGLYESEKHHRGNDPYLETSSTTSGKGGQSPYGSGVDAGVTPRSGLARDESAVPTTGSGHQQPASMSDHHYKRDAGIVGAGGIGASEAGQKLLPSDHSGHSATPQDRLAGSGHQPAIGANSSPYPSSNYSSGGQSQTGAHYERGPLAAGVVGAGAAVGGDNAQRMRDHDRTYPETQVQEHEYPGASTAAYPTHGRSNDSEKGHHTSQHTGRDAALVGGAAAGTGALAGHEHSQRNAAGYGNEPYQNDSPDSYIGRDTAIGGGTGTDSGLHGGTQRGHHAGKDIGAVEGAGAGAGALAGYGRSHRDVGDYSAEPYQSSSRDHRTGKDAAILGGAAGVGGLAEHEYSKKDAAKLQKEHDKEEKALEKQYLKENKHHDKELAKEEKAHEKAIEKSEKKHEKAVEKDETKHEHGGKKQGGLLGFLHRDKPDKELKEEEAQRQAAIHPGRSEEGGLAAGAGGTGTESRRAYDPLQEEHSSQSGIHDNPMEIHSAPTTHDAYGAHDSGHNKLHKDPPSKVIESRGYEFK